MVATADRALGRPTRQDLERRIAQLEQTLDAMNEAMWAEMQGRFYGFDAIKNDSCPACGGAVRVVMREREAPGIVLEAVDTAPRAENARARARFRQLERR